MKWFKHMTCSGDDEKLSAIIDELGMEGYGFYWRLLEIVAEKLDQKGETFCRFSAKKWGNFFQFSAKKFQKFAQILAEKRLIFVEISENFIKIDIPNLLKYQDNYQKNLQASNKKVSKPPINNSTVNSNNSIKEEEYINPPISPQGGKVCELPLSPQPSEEEKSDKQAEKYPADFEAFWQLYPCKEGKRDACKAWKRHKAKIPNLETLQKVIDAQKQSEQWQRGYIPHPATWLNGYRWQDEINDAANHNGMTQAEIEAARAFRRQANNEYR